jgi:hypothetical protein
VKLGVGGGFGRVFGCSLVFSYNVEGRSRTLQGGSLHVYPMLRHVDS